MRLHLGWVIPDEISQVSIHGRVSELRRVTDNGVEIDFLGQNDVGEVH